MLGLPNILDAIRDFIELGGPVLYGIMAVLLLMWTFIIERYWYLKVVYPGVRDKVISSWDARIDTRSWYAKRIREQLISEAEEGLRRHVALIKTLVALCPLFGLLGTVYGMIQVFDVMAVAGTGNARAMAAGVSQATVPGGDGRQRDRAAGRLAPASLMRAPGPPGPGVSNRFAR